MFLNYFKLSLRLMGRSPLFTFIKVSGLAVGLAMFLFLWQYTQNELRSDQQWKDSDRIYRFAGLAKWTDDKTHWNENHFGTCIASLVDQITPQYPEIVEVARILSQRNVAGMSLQSSHVVDHGPDLYLSTQSGASGKSFKSFRESDIAYASPNIFTFFRLPLIEGDPDQALKLAGSIVLSEKLAVKYFGEPHVSGQTILINDQIPLTVTGVFKDLPQNTHLSFDAVISMERIKNRLHVVKQEAHTPVHYIKVREGTNISQLVTRINKSHHKVINQSYSGDWEYGDAEVFVQSLHEMPFQSYLLDYYTVKSGFVLTLFKIAAIVILFIAWINYINLTSAQNLRRMKEAATRRVIGASARDLTFQFVTEVFLTSALALILALTLVQLMRVPMQTLLGLYLLPFDQIPESSLWVLLAAFAIGILFSAIYLAWMIVRSGPRQLVTSDSANAKVATTLFTLAQYTQAIVLVVFAFVIRTQINFILTRDIGLDRDQIVVIDLPLVHGVNFSTDLNTFLANTREMNPTVSQSVPGDYHVGFVHLIQPGVGTGIGVDCNGGVDEHFIPLFGIKMITGRNFIGDHPSDSSAILLSDITSSRLGFKTPDEAIGRIVMVGADHRAAATVIGVFADYKLRPLLNMGYYQSEGLALTYRRSIIADNPLTIPHKVSFRLSPQSLPQSIDKLRSYYNASFSDLLFNWYFLDDYINEKYQDHIVTVNQVTFFTVLAVGIACLGLLGMMVHKTQIKIKEIGIRKVLGAQVYHIAKLLLTASTKQLAAAALIGIPAAYYLTQQYFQKFSERIAMQWWHFALPVLIFIVVMFATIAVVVWRSARNNPVDALKCE